MWQAVATVEADTDNELDPATVNVPNINYIKKEQKNINKRDPKFRISIIQNNFILLLKLGQDSEKAAQSTV